jgi:putative heme-binding domain-containing protein
MNVHQLHQGQSWIGAAWSSSVGKAFVFLLVVLGSFLWVGHAITVLTGGEKKAGSAVEISPEGGEAIFWGKGRCSTCHSLGDQGSAVRCPNLGQFGEKFPLAIGARAAERAKIRSEKTGQNYSATDYLIESLADPGAFVVEGYKNEMAIVYAPPISLNLDEIKAVILYLQSQGGDVDIDALNNPSETAKKHYDRIQAATAAGGGDPGNGEAVYNDNCANCHKLKGKGGNVGPDLAGIAAKGASFISDAILRPAKTITKGFETYVAVDKTGRQTVGLKTRDDANGVTITKATGEEVAIARGDIKEITDDRTRSVMPDDLAGAMTVKDFQDLLAFMMMQKGE